MQKSSKPSGSKAASKRGAPSVGWVITFAVLSAALFGFNIYFSLRYGARARTSSSSVAGALGYVGGYVLLLPAIVLSIAAIWKRNRRPYILLLWFFWLMLFMTLCEVSLSSGRGH